MLIHLLMQSEMLKVIVSRTTRDTRKELERFMRDVKRSNPGARVKLDYDEVEVS